jgi:thioredoxin-related protein
MRVCTHVSHPRFRSLRKKNMNKPGKKIELAVNLAIILVAIMIGFVFVKNYLLAPQSTPESRDYRVPAGTKMSLPEVDWAQNGQTLLLVLKKGCRYCAESAPFYQRLVREMAGQNKVRLVAVLPQEVSEGKKYLSSLDVPIDEVRQAELETLNVQGTPTLILVNGKGEVMESWAGRLPAEKEMEVLRRIEEKNSSSYN